MHPSYVCLMKIADMDIQIIVSRFIYHLKVKVSRNRPRWTKGFQVG